MQKAVIETDLKDARDLTDRILGEVHNCGYDQEGLFAIRLAIEEALVNAIKHGNQNVRSKSVCVEFDVNSDRVEIQVTDEGDGFRPCDVPDPTADENLERPSGRGVMLMRVYMDEVEFNDRGNAVRMVKRNTRGAPCQANQAKACE